MDMMSHKRDPNSFKPSDLPSLNGKTFLVTGGNTGIGYATCIHLVVYGARVYIGARSEEKAQKAVADIKVLHPTGDLHILILDHADLDSVVAAAKRFCSQEAQLHGLVLNGGIMAVPYEITKDGFESQMQINYLAHWVLTSHLIPTLLSTARTFGPGSVRIVVVSSEGHNSWGTKGMLYDPGEIKNFGNFGRYGLSKLGNVLHAVTLNEKYGPGSDSANTGNGEIWTASLHPGFVDTQLNEKTHERAPWYLKWLHFVLRWTGTVRPWDEGSISSLFVAASPRFTADMSGKYLDHMTNIRKPNPSVENPDERKKLEAWTAKKMKTGGWA